jgi:hypothetical protein
MNYNARETGFTLLNLDAIALAQQQQAQGSGSLPPPSAPLDSSVTEETPTFEEQVQLAVASAPAVSCPTSPYWLLWGALGGASVFAAMRGGMEGGYRLSLKAVAAMAGGRLLYSAWEDWRRSQAQRSETGRCPPRDGEIRRPENAWSRTEVGFCPPRDGAVRRPQNPWR